MKNSGLDGPFALTNASIDQAVSQISPGAYAPGAVNTSGGLDISRVGRSDVDLNDRLKDYVGQYTAFKARYYPNASAAFEKECHLFHDFSPPDNAIHPDRPAGSNWLCPRCLVFG